MKKRSLTGIRATGSIHLGNYLGTIKPALKRQEDCECFYFIADLHALTSNRDPNALRESSYDIIATYLACGFDTKNNLIYRQSDIPSVTELMWYLSCVTGIGLLEKAHAYKDAVAANKETNHGVFAYPVLMAADILLYDADLVPVGKDQKQHVEMARDIAGSFNAIYGENTIKPPLPVIDEKVMTIPGLDGRKMSKSYHNTIPLFVPQKELRKLIMSIKTDSTPLEEPKVLNGSLVGQLYEHFSSSEEYRDLENRLQAGGLGWGHAKEELFQVIDREAAPLRKRYDEIRPDKGYLQRELALGAERATVIAQSVLNRVRKSVGVGE